jgi:hypothetical protein
MTEALPFNYPSQSSGSMQAVSMPEISILEAGTYIGYHVVKSIL